MFAIYRAVFRAPGTAAFCAAGFLMRMPIAMYPLGLLLLISTKTHHYGFAGALSGAYILGGAPGNPIGARLVDRFGQGRVLLPAAAVHVAAVVALIAISEAGLADWLLLRRPRSSASATSRSARSCGPGGRTSSTAVPNSAPPTPSNPPWTR